MVTIEEIIATAKTKESWSVNHKFNYGPIDYLYEHVVQKCASGLDAITKAITEFEQHVHRVTDAETYFVWQHRKYDLIVRSNELVIAMRDAFPAVPFMTVCQWIRKYEGKQQTSTAIHLSLVPPDIANQCEELYSIFPTHELLRKGSL